MSITSRSLAAVAVVILVLCATSAVVATVPYGLDSPNEVDVSDSVIVIGYERYGFDGVARVERGEEFVVRATAPDNAAYGVDLYSSDRMPVALSDRTLRGNDSTSFETGHLTPGSYVAVLIDEQEIKAVLPVVVEGYAVSLDDVPDSVGTGADLTVTASLSKDPSSPEASRVELVVTERESGYVVTRTDMTTDGSGYAGTVRLRNPGAYQVYVNVRGQKSVRGQEVVLGFSDPRTVSVTGTPASVGATASEPGTPVPDVTATAAPGGSTSRPDSTAAPEGVLTRNATLGDSSLDEGPPVGAVSVLFGLFLAVGLLYWFRR